MRTGNGPASVPSVRMNRAVAFPVGMNLGVHVPSIVDMWRGRITMGEMKQKSIDLENEVRALQAELGTVKQQLEIQFQINDILSRRIDGTWKGIKTQHECIKDLREILSKALEMIKLIY